MKKRKILAASLLCAMICSALPVTNTSAKEVEEVKLKVHSTSNRELDRELTGTPNTISVRELTVPTIIPINDGLIPSSTPFDLLQVEEEIYSLVSEEDAILPEDVENIVFYTTKDIELKSSADDSSEIVTVIPKGTAVELSQSGDKFAFVTLDGKSGVVDIENLSKDKVEVEEVKTEVSEETDKEETKSEVVSQEKVEVKTESKVEEKKETKPEVKTETKAEKKETVVQPTKKSVTLYATTTLNVRAKADVLSSRVGGLQAGAQVNGYDIGDWVEFEFNDKTAYVTKSYLSTEKPVIKETKKEEVKKEETTTAAAPSTDSSAVDVVIKSAMAQLGKRYIWAASNPNVGFDCSGLMYYAFGQAGYKLNRVAADQVRNGSPIAKSQLQPGDMVFFSNSGPGGYIGHVGLYIGDGKMIHASDPSTGVIISNIMSGYYANTYSGAVRVIK